jgi:hypothetical protein
MDNIRYKTNLLLGFSIMCALVPFSVVSVILTTLGPSGLTNKILSQTLHPTYLGSVLVGTIIYFLAGRIIRLKKWVIIVLAFGITLLSCFSLCLFFLFKDIGVLGEEPGALTFLFLDPGIEEFTIYTLMVLAVFLLAEWTLSVNFRKVWILNILIYFIFMSMLGNTVIQQLPNTNQLFWVLRLASRYIFTITVVVTLLTFLTDFFFLLFWEFSSRGKDLSI